jgi:hypothetical protein
VRSILAHLSSIAFLALVAAHYATAKTLDIYFIDVEGGQSTLLITPDESTTHWIKLSAAEDGSFRVLNGRTGEWKYYPARPAS